MTATNLRRETAGATPAPRDGLHGASADEAVRSPGTITLTAAVFVRRKATRVGPFRVGHVGWAFQLGPADAIGVDLAAGSAGGWSAGSLENYGGYPIASARRADFWTDVFDDPLMPMRARNYDEYKLIEVANATPEAALRAQRRVHARPYLLLFANCADGVATVLRAFGADLPSARRHPSPNDWYDRIAGPSLVVREVVTPTPGSRG